MDKYPKVLVISHNCFSKTGSNGRTLGNFFINWPTESIAQFYISNETPDSDVCQNYFRILDKEALESLLKGNEVGKIIKKKVLSDENFDESLNNSYKSHKKKRMKRSPFNYFVRNLVWDSKRWKGKKYEEWINDFNPEVILLQLGDYAFMLRIALNIAESKEIPLVIYSSEDYYFKDKKSFSPLYHYYRFDYKNQLKKVISYSSYSIYNSDMLESAYQNEFEHKSTVIMTSTNIIPKIKNKNYFPPRVSYLGNLGVGRHEPLIEIAEKLNELNSNIYLDIYGRIRNEDVEKELKACPSIKLKGFIPYDDVIKTMQESDLLIHAENHSEHYQWDLKHAFSTKIADSLASGTCLFVYGPTTMAGIKYLKDTQSAVVVSDSKKLSEKLEEILLNKQLRDEYVDRAIETVEKFHNQSINAMKFRELIEDITKK